MKQYPKYKESGIQWIGQVPEHWDVSKLKYFVECRMGETILATETTKKGIPIYSATQDDSIFGYIENPKLTLRCGDLVIPARGNSIGCVSMVKEEVATCTQTTICVRNIHNLINRFLLYCCVGFKEYWYRYEGGAIPQITVDQVLNNVLVLPPLSEQEAIAGYLDKQTGKIDKSIESLEQQKADLQQYRTSVISEAVTRGLNPNAPLKDSGVQWIGQIPAGWGLTKLKYLTTKIGSGITPSGGATVYQDSGVLFIRSQNVHADGLRLDDVAYISDDIDNKMQGSRVLFGDVLLNITGASIGRCTTFNLENTRANVNQHVCIVRPIQELVLSKYLQYVLNSKLGQTQIDLYQTGGNREGLNFEQLKNFLIPSISLPEQEAIAAYLDEQTGKIDTAIATIDQQIADLRAYRTALITEAVTGKVDVRVSV